MTDQELYEWRTELELLSLDFVRPVYSWLGTGILYEETLRGLCRDSLMGRHGRQTVESRPESPFRLDADQITQLLEMLERAMGRTAKERLQHWIRFIACPDSHNPWVVYQDMLESWASRLRRTGDDRIGLSNPHRVEAELRLVGQFDLPRKILLEQTRKSITEWDFPLFRKRGLLEIPEGSDFFPFVDAIILTIETKRFQDFWRWFASVATQDDFRAIAAAAKNETAGENAVYCDPHDLPLPPDEPRNGQDASLAP